jgi:hypothetical protein
VDQLAVLPSCQLDVHSRLLHCVLARALLPNGIRGSIQLVSLLWKWIRRPERLCWTRVYHGVRCASRVNRRNARVLPIEPNRADKRSAGELVVGDVVDFEPAGLVVA